MTVLQLDRDQLVAETYVQDGIGCYPKRLLQLDRDQLVAETIDSKTVLHSEGGLQLDRDQLVAETPTSGENRRGVTCFN